LEIPDQVRDDEFEYVPRTLPRLPGAPWREHIFPKSRHAIAGVLNYIK